MPPRADPDPRPCRVALEVNDVRPPEMAGILDHPDFAAWTRGVVAEAKPDLLFFNMLGTHQDRQDIGPEQAAENVNALLAVTDLPLIVRPAGNYEKQNKVVTRCAELARRPVILGSAVQDNYRAVTAAAIAGGHSLLTESPIDVNIAKQVNILVTQMSFPLERILMDPMTGGLGYGLEYTYSVIERICLQAAQGDWLMSPPLVCLIGPETWKLKEVRGGGLGLGVNWEVTTALAVMLAGADIVCVRHPDSIKTLRACMAEMGPGLPQRAALTPAHP